MIEKGYLLGDRYRIIDTLGEGGMANVYLAEDIILQRKVAVKILRLDLRKEPQILDRFKREALATSELSHPNIVPVLDVGSDHGLPYMVMEYVSGPDLKQYIRKNYPLDLHEVIRIMDQILSAVSLAHNHNVIHRDLKPQNILMDRHGNIKIADFGIAVALNQSTVTQTNSAMGSVHYMSPEQTRGGLVTKQSDLYSLGIILYELITGKVPFDGDTAVAIALKHAQEPIPSLKEKDEQIPQALENVVLKATAKDPRDRYASAQEMKEDLDTSLDPARAGEAVFLPEHAVNNDETIVLPQFKKQVPEEEPEKKEEEDHQQTEPAGLGLNLKKYKWWWLFIGLAAVLVVCLLLFVLIGRNQVNVPDVTNLTETSARAKLVKAGLKVGSVRRKYSENVSKGEVISSSPGAQQLINKGSAVDLYISKGQNMVKVPDVVGSDYDDAVKKLEKMGFEVIRENQFSDEVPPDHIINQSIAAGVEVKPTQTTITLLVSKGRNAPQPKDTIKLKDLKDSSLKYAQEYAREHGLTLQIIQKYSDKVDKNTVISMAPSAGTKVERGSTITVTISKGAEKDVNSSIVKTFTVNYKENDDDDNDDENETDQSNHVQIYISDDKHSLSNIYRDLYIKRDTNFSIPFSLKNGAGELKVVRDGQTILNEKVSK